MKVGYAFITASLAMILMVSASKVDYTGHMVIRTVPETREQIEFLLKMEKQLNLDFWSLPRGINDPADIRVSPQSYYRVARSLAEKKMNHNIVIQDLGALIRAEEQEIALRRAIAPAGKALDYTSYHTYDEIVAHLDELSAGSSGLMNVTREGKTHEGRDIVQVVISTGVSTTRPVIFFECNIHAREWITSATCTWIIENLVKNYNVDPEITNLINQHDWRFVPVANPDGHDYTWTTDRMWRKNRVPNIGSPCIGVDVNRNFPIGFGDPAGADPNACGETYHGPRALSELESTLLRDLVRRDSYRTKAALSIHSFSQLWLSPYGYTSELPANYSEMVRVMDIGANALKAVYGTEYVFGNTADTIYTATGITTDYYFSGENIFHSYTLELRDTGTFGFILPADQIIPTAEETWAGLKAFIQAI